MSPSLIIEDQPIIFLPFLLLNMTRWPNMWMLGANGSSFISASVKWDLQSSH
jgi:hypothetical protein